MKTPFALENDKIAEIIQAKFGLAVTNLEFIPKGQVSWVYRCRSSDQRWVIKIQKKRPLRANSSIVKVLMQAKYPWMPTQVLTKRGDVWARHRGAYYSLQQYIDPGENWDVFVLDDMYLPQLGEALRALHDIVLPRSVVAKASRRSYPLVWTKRLVKLLWKIKYSPRKRARLLRDLYREYDSKIVDVVRHLRENSRYHDTSRVLVHGDIHPFNILRPSGGRLYIIDWDTLHLSDREQDLMYFDDRQLGLISRGYGKNLLQDSAKLAYYRTYLSVRELAHFGNRAYTAREEEVYQQQIETIEEVLGKLTQADY